MTFHATIFLIGYYNTLKNYLMIEKNWLNSFNTRINTVK